MKTFHKAAFLISLFPWTFLPREACGQRTTIICGLSSAGVGAVRDAVYLRDGFWVNNTWSGSGWQDQNPKQREPQSAVLSISLSKPFDQRPESPFDLDSVLEEIPLLGTPGSARNGFTFYDDEEIYFIG
jgi:hypothetical protein